MKTLLAFLAALGFEAANAYPSFQGAIPNGASVPSPCNINEMWGGVGHELQAGQGPLNQFGRDFLAAKKIWTAELCRKDSDGDGKTNGEELGDPNCTWRQGQRSPQGRTLSHPGICEPIDSDRCKPKNTFLTTIESCAAKMGVAKAEFCPQLKTIPNLKTIELRFNTTVVPSNETTYMCQHYAMPSDQEYQIVAYEMLIDNQELLHHMVFGACSQEEDDRLTAGTQYRTPEVCNMNMDICGDVSLVWGFGLPGRCYSNLNGVWIGQNSFKRAVMQLHYNNPSNYEGVKDSSGIKIYYIPRSRQYDNAMFQYGQMDFAIPPRRASTKVSAELFPTPSCSADLFGQSRYYMTSIFFHMHQMGTHAKVQIKRRNGRVDTLIDEDVTYDRPKYLTWETMEEAPRLEAGDDIDVECTFASTDKTKYTFFGEATSDEMCIVFMEVFPRPQNKSYHGYLSMSDVNTCQWNEFQKNPRYTFVKDGCDFTNFTTRMRTIAASAGGGVGDNCETNVYPATSCSASCRSFLDRNQLASDPCLNSPMFRMATAFVDTPAYEGTFRMQSHINYCLGRPTLPPSNSETANSLRQNFISFFSSLFPFL